MKPFVKGKTGQKQRNKRPARLQKTQLTKKQIGQKVVVSQIFHDNGKQMQFLQSRHMLSLMFLKCRNLNLPTGDLFAFTGVSAVQLNGCQLPKLN